MTELRFHPAARVELVEAVVYHEEQRPGYGDRFEAEVQEAVDRILQFPESGSPLKDYPPELEARAFRLQTLRYSLIVAVVDGEQLVSAVAHHSRKPGYWRERVK